MAAATTQFDLTSRTAVVTGCLGKLGPIWSAALLEAGASVAGLDLPGAKLSVEFQRLLERYGPERLRLYPADVTKPATLREALASCCRESGEPSILVNNAGIDQPPRVGKARHRWHDIPAEVCREILEVNLLGTFLTTQVFAAPMVRAGGGSIINIGSLYAGVSPDARFYDHLRSPDNDAPFIKPPFYGASKAGVVNLSRYLATHLAPHGVRVNALSPGGVLGEQDDEFKRKFCDRVPLRRMATAADLKGPLLFLASDASAYVTGTELLVDGGFTAW